MGVPGEDRGRPLGGRQEAPKRAMERANLVDLRPHDLRRSFASLLVNSNVDIYQVKDLLGHSSVIMTQKAYAHLHQGTLRAAGEVMARTVEEALRGTTQPDIPLPL